MASDHLLDWSFAPTLPMGIKINSITITRTSVRKPSTSWKHTRVGKVSLSPPVNRIAFGCAGAPRSYGQNLVFYTEKYSSSPVWFIPVFSLAIRPTYGNVKGVAIIPLQLLSSYWALGYHGAMARDSHAYPNKQMHRSYPR